MSEKVFEEIMVEKCHIWQKKFILKGKGIYSNTRI